MRQPHPRRRSVRADFLESLELRLLYARIEGVDVSQYQGTMNFSTTYAAGKRFAFIRASRSDTIPDIDLTYNIPRAKSAGLIVGVYHRGLPFSYTPDSNNPADFRDPIVDADSFLSVATPYIGAGYMRPVLDIENGASLNTTQVNNYTLNEWVVAWIDRVKQVTGVQPIVYCNTNYANIMNKTVTADYPHVPTAAPDIWIANWNETSYGDPITGTGNPPQGVWGTGSGWDFWQYSSKGTGSTYGATSTYIDLDVFNGDNINDLKRRFVIGAPTALPSGPSPGNGASNVTAGTILLNWNNTPGATRYDVYLDNMTTPIASNVTVSQYSVANVSAGPHAWRIVAKGASNDEDTHVSGPTWSFTAVAPLPGVPSDPSPNTPFVTSKPVLLDWADASNATSYDVYLNGSATPTFINLTSSQASGWSPAEGVSTWRVVAKNAAGSTTGPTWSFTIDSIAPAASYGAQTPTSAAAFLDFTVTYTDATSGVYVMSLDHNDVYVTGPNDYSQAATLVSIDVASNGTPRTATYRIAAPGGTWDETDNGSYAVHQNAAQVRDVAGGFRAAGTIGTFTANLALPFAYKAGSVLHIDFDGTATPVALAHAGGIFSATRSGTTLTFDGITLVDVGGTSGDDLLEIGSAIPVPLTFDNQGGNDAITVTGGTFTFDTDFAPAERNVDVTVAAGAAAIFATTLHVDALAIHGQAAMTPGGNSVLIVKSLTITPEAGARLDLADNDMVIDYPSGAASPSGTFDGTTYSGASGHIQSGYNGGAWDGNGIFTSESNAASGLTTLAIVDAANLYGIGAADTALFGNETIDGSSVLIKYTYGDDSNFDGKLDADDYGTIDFNILVRGASGYHNGDFNYDGVINADDYGSIDFNILAQGVAL